MGRLLNPLWLQRMRHAKGYGVHSPFAFGLITEVLNPGRRYAYYSEAAAPGHTSRLAMRLTGRFGLKTVYAEGPAAEALSISPSMIRAGSAAEAEFLIADLGGGGHEPSEELLRRIGGGKAAVVLVLNHGGINSKPLRRLTGAMGDHGMSFTNRRSRAVLALLPHLPRQDFAVAF